MPGKPLEDLRHADGQRHRAAGASRQFLAHLAREQVEVHGVQPEFR